MKLAPQPVASDVAMGIRQKLAGVRNLSVTTGNGIITVTAPGCDKDRVQAVIDGYKDSGFSITLDRRISI
jgi:hypothetical protein